MIPFAAAHICGTLEAVDVAARGQKGFQVATIRIRIGFGSDDEKPRYATAEATHEARKMAEAIPIGSVVIIHGIAEAREWQGRWFPSIRVETIARVEVPEREAKAQGQEPRKAARVTPQAHAAPVEPQQAVAADEDLPF